MDPHEMRQSQDGQEKEERAPAAAAGPGQGGKGAVATEVAVAGQGGKGAGGEGAVAVGKQVSTKSEADMEEERRTKEIVRQFFETTSAHGWGHVARAPNYPVKALWTVVTLTAFAINVAHVTILVSQYLRFPYEQIQSFLIVSVIVIIVSLVNLAMLQLAYGASVSWCRVPGTIALLTAGLVTEVEVAYIEFPSITICNLQPISMSTANSLLLNSSTEFFRWNNTTKYFFHELESQANDTHTYEIWYDRMRGPRGFFENIGDESRIVGHQPSDFILGCTFGKEVCGSVNFSYFQSPSFFNCYTFNGGNMEVEKLMARATGPEAGLSLVLYLESDNGDMRYDGPYYTYLNVGNSAGVRVTIHAPDTRPSPIDFGFDIPPGFSSSTGINVLQYVRLGPPYGKCRAEEPPAKGMGQFVYSAHACLMACQQEYIYSNCGCLSSLLPVPVSMNGKSYCGYFNESDPVHVFKKSDCEADRMDEFANDEALRSRCTCDAPCSESTYRTDLSYAYWPIDFSQEEFFRKYVLKNKNRDQLKAYQNLKGFNFSEIVHQGLVRKNFIRLNVYLKSLIIEETVQKGSYTFFNLFSDIGGTFGLWIGMSVLTWGEVFELTTHLLLRWIKKLRRERYELN